MGLIKLTAVILLGIILFSGCGGDSGNHQKKPVQQSDLIRSDGTNTAALDVNGDGVLYQCPMHFQVISDSLAACPLCMMDLEKYNVAEAEVNLQKHYHQ